jgi:uncharacterized protein YcaQ
MTKISIEQARNAIINRQLYSFNGDNEIDNVYNTIDHLGYIQIDTISVIERAHHHTLWTRNPEYKKQSIHELQVNQKRIFEYWGHALSYLPMKDYRFFCYRKTDFSRGWENKWISENSDVLDFVLKRISCEGPLSSKDFAKPENHKSQGWGSSKPTKIALELLFWRGDLMVKERNKFARIYDLTENVLPKKIKTEIPTAEEAARFQIIRALNSMAIADLYDINDYIHVVTKKAISDQLTILLAEDIIKEVRIDTQENKKYYTLSDIADEILCDTNIPDKIFILSPFDNVVINRKRLKSLFNFDYKIECYVPKNKRKYGYFVLPILWKNNFVGRIDIKADRKEKLLLVKSIYFEPGFESNKEIKVLLNIKLQEFATFCDCSEYRYFL